VENPTRGFAIQLFSENAVTLLKLTVNMAAADLIVSESRCRISVHSKFQPAHMIDRDLETFLPQSGHSVTGMREKISTEFQFF